MSKSEDGKMTRREIFNAAAASPIALIAGPAIAGDEVFPYARPVAVATVASSPDVDLLQAVSLAVEADARRSAFDQEADEAFERIGYVPIPDALEHRRDIDFPYICCDQNRCAEYRLSEERGWCSIYESPDDLTPWAQRWLRGEESSLDRRFWTDAHDARMHEIAAALKQWDRDQRHAEAAAGYDVPVAASQRETETIDKLLRQIVLSPALTPQGLAAKIRAATVARVFYPGSVRELQAMLAGPKPDWDKAVTTSICADAANLGAEERERSQVG